MAVQVIYGAGAISQSPIYSSAAKSPALSSKLPIDSSRSPRLSPQISPRQWRPVMPGYKPPLQSRNSVVVQRTIEVQQNSNVLESGSDLKKYIPVMPRRVASACFICNVLCPGLGTFLSGSSIFCCSRIQSNGTMAKKMTILKMNTWIAFLQFVTAFICFLGWIWSIMWGASFISISRNGSYLGEASTGRGRSNTLSTVAHRRRPRRTRTRTTSNRSISSYNQAPIIVLQEAPVIIQSNHPDSSSLNTDNLQHDINLNPLNPRHNRILRHQYGENFPSLFLNPQNLENIVINHAIPNFYMTDGTLEGASSNKL